MSERIPRIALIMRTSISFRRVAVIVIGVLVGLIAFSPGAQADHAGKVFECPELRGYKPGRVSTPSGGMLGSYRTAAGTCSYFVPDMGIANEIGTGFVSISYNGVWHPTVPVEEPTDYRFWCNWEKLNKPRPPDVRSISTTHAVFVTAKLSKIYRVGSEIPTEVVVLFEQAAKDVVTLLEPRSLPCPGQLQGREPASVPDQNSVVPDIPSTEETSESPRDRVRRSMAQNLADYGFDRQRFLKSLGADENGQISPGSIFAQADIFFAQLRDARWRAENDLEEFRDQARADVARLEGEIRQLLDSFRARAHGLRDALDAMEKGFVGDADYGEFLETVNAYRGGSPWLS